MRIIIFMLLILTLQLLTRIPYASSSTDTACTDNPLGSSYSSVNMLLGNSLCDRVVQQDIGNAMKEVCTDPSKRADDVYKALLTRIQTLEKSIDDVLAQLATLKLSTGLPTCRAGYEYYGEDRFCYMFHSECKSWSDARQICQQEGGDLISLNDRNLDFFRDVAQAKAGSCNNFWVGTTDAASEGQWNWLNGESVTSAIWASGQPDNWGSKENCGGLTKMFGYKLNDDDCATNQHFICRAAS